MSGYIMDLRGLVGSRPLIQCGASVICLNERNEILLQRRGDDGSWAYCGGSVELYERVEDAATREFYEETGLRAKSLELFGVFSGPEMAHTYPNGHQVSNIDIVFICRDYEGSLKADGDEVLELGFFPLDGLPSPIFAANRLALAKYLDQADSDIM